MGNVQSDFTRVESLWTRLSIPRNLAYRLVGDEVFCCRLGPGIEDRYAMVGGIGVDVFAALEKRVALSSFTDSVIARYGVAPDELLAGLEQFLMSGLGAGLFADCHPEDKMLNPEPPFVAADEELTEDDVLDAMYAKASTAAIPLKVFFELTHQCNHRCQHCYLGLAAGVPPRPALPTSRQLELLEELAAAGVLELILTGGEPTLHPDFPRILERAADLHFAIGLLTNGTRLGDEMLDRLTAVPLDHIRIPLYGLEEYHNRFVQNRHAFQEIWKGVLALAGRGAPVTITSTLMSDNGPDLLQLKRRLDELDIPFRVSSVVYPTIDRDETPIQYRATGDQFRDLIVELDIQLRRSRCTAGQSRFRISPDGYLHPCEMLSVINFGNLASESFEKVLQSPVRQEWLPQFQSYLTAKDASGCGNCLARPYCPDCVGLSFLESASFSGRCRQACQFAHTFAYVHEQDNLFAEPAQIQ